MEPAKRVTASHLHNEGSAVPYPRSTVAVSALVQGVAGGLGWSSMAAALSELPLGPVERAVLWAAGPLGIVLASVTGGQVVDRFGARRVGAVGLLVGALACGLRAGASEVFALAACMALFGAQIGFVAPALSRALAASVPAASLSRVNRGLLPAYGVGTVLSFLLVGAQWREAMLVIAAGMVALALVWFVVIEDVQERRLVPALAEVKVLLANLGVRRVATMQFLLFGSYLAVLPQLTSVLGAGAVPTWLTAAVVGNLLADRGSERVGLRRPFVLAGAALAGVAGFALALGAGWWALIAFGFGGGLVAPLLLALPLELPYLGSPRLGMALGVVLLGGQLGGVLLPLLGAVALQQAGAPAFFGALAVAHFLVLFPALRLAETGPRARVHPARVDFSGAPA